VDKYEQKNKRKITFNFKATFNTSTFFATFVFSY